MRSSFISRGTRLGGFVAGLVGVAGYCVAAPETSPPPSPSSASRVEELERKFVELEQQLDKLRKDVGKTQITDPNFWANRFSFGGYGEIHANMGESNTPHKIDIHRFVFYVGYNFADWIKLHSETELEHAFVQDGSGGEVALEQLYVDFLCWEPLNIRAGRMLTPLGITNLKHEPPSTWGVERPTFDTVIIPTTWSSDGAGLFGKLLPSLRYEGYVVGGMDGTKFSATNGIRSGRIEERSSLHEPAVTGRLDYFPFLDFAEATDQALRLGASTYAGGVNNGNNGINPGGAVRDSSLWIKSADAEYRFWLFELRGALAQVTIDHARNIGGGVAREILGWYTEGGLHLFPESWRTGKWEKTDVVAFARYEEDDTQYRMPSGVARTGAGDRRETTLGVNLYLTHNFVVKADYQIRDDRSPTSKPDNLYNVGLGWQF